MIVNLFANKRPLPEKNWLSHAAIAIYESHGFVHLYYCRMSGIPKLIEDMEALLSDVQECITENRNTFVLVIDISTEAPAYALLQPLASKIAERLGIQMAQIVVISQNRASQITTKSNEGDFSWAFADSFSWEASNHSDDFSQVTPLKNIDYHSDETKIFICLNNAHRPWRLATYAYLETRGIAKDTYLSFRMLVPAKGGKNYASDERFQESVRRAFEGFPSLKSDIESLINSNDSLDRSVDDLTDVTKTAQLIWRSPAHAYSKSLIDIVTESDFSNGTSVRRFTEKTLKPLLHGRPFVVIGAPLTLAAIRDFGFKTFSGFINEEYDSIVSPQDRLNAVLDEIKRLYELLRFDPGSINELSDICDFNQDHIASLRFQDKILEKHLETLRNSLGLREVPEVFF